MAFIFLMVGCANLLPAGDSPSSLNLPRNGLFFRATNGDHVVNIVGVKHYHRLQGELPSHILEEIYRTDSLMHERHDWDLNPDRIWNKEFQSIPPFSYSNPNYQPSDRAMGYLSQFTNFSDANWRIFKNSHPLGLGRTFLLMSAAKAASPSEQHLANGRLIPEQIDYERRLRDAASSLKKKILPIEPAWGGLRFWARDCGGQEINADWLDLQIQVHQQSADVLRLEQNIGDAVIAGDLSRLAHAEDARQAIAADSRIIEKCLIGNRNTSWIQQLELDFKNGVAQRPMLVVGATHILPRTMENSSLLALFQLRGFRLQRVCSNKTIDFIYQGKSGIPGCD